MLSPRWAAFASVSFLLACSSSGSTPTSGGGGEGPTSTTTSTTSTNHGSSTTTTSSQGGGATTSTTATGPGGAGGGATTSTTTTTTTTTGAGGGTMFPAGTICNDSGQARTPPATVQHVIVILFENQNLGSVNGNSAAPYMNSIANACAQSTNFTDDCFADNLVSLPHYLALTSGSNCNRGLDQTGSGCITDDGDATSHKLSTTSIFAQVPSWKSYQESMPSACDASSSGEYAAKHNPAAYYSGLSNCSANDVPIAAVTCTSTHMTPCTTPNNAFTTDLANDTLPAYSFITPNLQNDMHDGTVTQADNWMLTYLPLILQSRAYLDGEVVLFALWDEQDSSQFGGTTPNFFVSPYITAGTTSANRMNLFSALRATENLLGITTYLGCASGTQPGGGACPSGSTIDMRAELGF